MSLYGQESEARLVASFLPRLRNRIVIDVGAELGEFTAEMLAAGAEAVHAIEPEPRNVAALRQRFKADRRVRIHACAASRDDGDVVLRLATGRDGTPVTFAHTILECDPTDTLAWRETLTVRARSLASLVQDGDLPGCVGVLKIDTEGHDFAVLEGMGSLQCDVVMLEHWVELPRSLGTCPWTLDDVVGLLRPRGFSQFAFIAHRHEFVILEWGSAALESDEMGNLVFLHERAVSTLLPEVIACASELGVRTVEVAEMYVHAAQERLELIEQLDAELHNASKR